MQTTSTTLTLHRIDELTIKINDFEPIKGGCYCPVPRFISQKKATLNVESYDEMCFKWAVLAGLYSRTVKNKNRVSNYRLYAHVLNFDGISFPVALTDVCRFEAQNDVSVNVFGLEKQNEAKYLCMPIYLTGNKKENHVNLLMVEKDATGLSLEPTYHYVTIRNLGRLLGKQINLSQNKKTVCDRCLNSFSVQSKLIEHREFCGNTDSMCQLEVPCRKEDRIVEFTKYRNAVFKPFVLYANLQGIMEGPSRIISSVGLYVKNRMFPKESYYAAKRGPDCLQWFCQELMSLSTKINERLEQPNAPNCKLTKQQKTDYDLATLCHICDRKYYGKNIKIRDHCHISGSYRGPAHIACSLNVRGKARVSVVFHGLRESDAACVIAKVNELIAGDVTINRIDPQHPFTFTKRVLRETKEVSYSKNTYLKLIDSFSFIPKSLEILAGNLNEEQLDHLKSGLSQANDEQLMLAVQKSALVPVIDDWSMYDDRSLPAQWLFRSENGVEASEDEYDNSRSIWNSFGVTTVGEFCDLCLKIDVLRLVDVFESFRQTFFDIYSLDPVHYDSAALLAWESMLKFSKVRAELIGDIDQLLFVEKGYRPAFTHSPSSYAKANHVSMGDKYNPSQPEEYLLHFRAFDHLHERALSEYLPLSDFAWMPNISDFDVTSVPDDNPNGYILEVDLEYPTAFHKSHYDYPLCSEHMGPNHSDKQKYILHYRVLKQALAHGLLLKTIHRILRFKQSPFMRSFVQKNIKTAELSTENEIIRDICQLLNRALYEAATYNLRTSSETRLVKIWNAKNGIRRMVAMPHFNDSHILGESCVAIEMLPMKLVYNQTIAVGTTVLEMSKYLLNEFHYAHVKGKNAAEGFVELIYADGDSMIYRSNENIVQKCVQSSGGLMADANPEGLITEFVCAGPKMVGIRIGGEDVGDDPLQHITFDDYFRYRCALFPPTKEEGSIFDIPQANVDTNDQFIPRPQALVIQGMKSSTEEDSKLFVKMF